MKQPTLKSQLLQRFFAHEGEWIHKGKIEAVRWQNQKNFTYYLPDNVGVTLRKLVRDGKIEVRDDVNRKSVEYRFKRV